MERHLSQNPISAGSSKAKDSGGVQLLSLTVCYHVSMTSHGWNVLNWGKIHRRAQSNPLGLFFFPGETTVWHIKNTNPDGSPILTALSAILRSLAVLLILITQRGQCDRLSWLRKSLQPQISHKYLLSVEILILGFCMVFVKTIARSSARGQSFESLHCSKPRIWHRWRQKNRHQPNA